MYDDFNSMDYSDARDDMMDMFEKLLQDKTLVFAGNNTPFDKASSITP